MSTKNSMQWPVMVVFLLIGALIFGLYTYKNGSSNPTFPTENRDYTPPDQNENNPSRNEEINFRGKKLIYTKHAKCRMGCRFIDKEEVGEVLANGRINHKKSNPSDPRGCPIVALEATTHDGQLVRAIVADCDDVAKLVTVIDLKNKYKCHCD